MKRLLTAMVCLSLISGCASQGAITEPSPQSFDESLRPRDLTVTPFNAPTSVFPTAMATLPTGIRDNLITATVILGSGDTVGSLYLQQQQQWLQLQYPGASSTAAYGPDEQDGFYRVVGSYTKTGESNDNGYLYDSSTKAYITIDAPPGLCAPKACNYTIAHSAYGSAKRYKVVGNFDAVAPPTNLAGNYPAAGHAFLYDSAGRSFKTIDVSGAKSTTAYGIWIDGKTIAVAGGYTDAKGIHAYVRDLGKPKAPAQVVYDHPGSAITHFEGITGAGGPGNYNVIGDYSDARDGSALYGFFLQIRNWKAGEPVVIGKLTANSVWNRTVIGVYKDSGNISGFTATVPVQDPP
jgi:subtilase-type serine protease